MTVSFHRFFPTVLMVTIFLFGISVCISKAQASDLRLVLPSWSNTLMVAEVNRVNGLDATFNGNLWIEAELIAQRWSDAEPNQEQSLRIRLVPVQDPATSLPHFLGYPVVSINLLNGAELVASVFDVALLEQLRNGDVSRLNLKAEFLLENYSVGVECDSPWARARVTKLRKSTKVILAGNALPSEC